MSFLRTTRTVPVTAGAFISHLRESSLGLKLLLRDFKLTHPIQFSNHGVARAHLELARSAVVEFDWNTTRLSSQVVGNSQAILSVLRRWCTPSTSSGKGRPIPSTNQDPRNLNQDEVFEPNIPIEDDVDDDELYDDGEDMVFDDDSDIEEVPQRSEGPEDEAGPSGVGRAFEENLTSNDESNLEGGRQEDRAPAGNAARDPTSGVQGEDDERDTVAVGSDGVRPRDRSRQEEEIEMPAPDDSFDGGD